MVELGVKSEAQLCLGIASLIYGSFGVASSISLCITMPKISDCSTVVD